VSGECSGAGLAVSLALRVRAEREVRRPLALYLHSPFVDATLSSPSIDTNEKSDPWLSRSRLLTMAGAWTQGDDPAAPLHSPLHADLSKLPPLLVFAAADEALAGDARALVARARAAGVAATLTLVTDSVHSFALFDFLSETRAALDTIAEHARAIAGQRGQRLDEPGAGSIH